MGHEIPGGFTLTSSFALLNRTNTIHVHPLPKESVKTIPEKRKIVCAARKSKPSPSSQVLLTSPLVVEDGPIPVVPPSEDMPCKGGSDTPWRIYVAEDVEALPLYMRRKALINLKRTEVVAEPALEAPAVQEVPLIPPRFRRYMPIYNKPKVKSVRLILGCPPPSTPLIKESGKSKEGTRASLRIRNKKFLQEANR